MSIESELIEKGIIIEQAYISGEYVDCDDKISVLNPATEDTIGYIPDIPADFVIHAITSSVEAQRKFACSSKEERSEILSNWHDNMIRSRKDIARLITLENGKTLREAENEVDYAAGYLDWFSKEALKNHDYEIEANNIFRSRKVTYVPVGVTAAITPWNFPLAMITRKAGAAIAAGCSMIIKPSELTPFSAIFMCKMAMESGMPKDLLQIVTGFPKEIGEILLNAFQIRKMSFTGSTAVGRYLMKNSADSLKKLSMELGGNAPLIINKDSDLEVAVNMVLNGKFRNNGQSCTAVNRILVHKSIYDRFMDKILEVVSGLSVGDGFDERNYLGSVINKTALIRLERLIETTLDQGAKLIYGGKRIGDKGYFLQPAIFTEVQNNMDIARNEIFGPIISILTFSDEEEAITIANDTDYGLAAYICGKDNERNTKMAERLNFGMIGINDTRISDARIPFGGVKNSGFGREGGIEGIFEYMETKYIANAY